MTRKLKALDRFASLLLVLLLGAASFFALDWRFGWVLSYPDSISLAPVTDVMDASWFAWTYAVVAVLLGLLGLWWLLAHARRPHENTLRLRGSGGAGRLEVDLSSVAVAVADRFSELTPTDGVRGRTRTIGSHQVVEVTARLAARADGQSIAHAAQTVSDELALALPDGDATCRVLLDRPRRVPRVGGGSRETTARVH